MIRERLSPALWRFGPEAPGHPRTFLLAPFGGGSAYGVAEWVPHLARRGERALALQYPGRGPRQHEPPAERLAELARECAGEIDGHCEGRLVLVGHSLGGVLCYEIALVLEELGREVELLAVSAARPPDRQRLRPAAVLAMSRDDWLAEVATGGNVEPGQELGEIADLLVPALRADYLMLAGYQPGGHRRVSCPLLALGGSGDPWVTRDHLLGWRAWTTGPASARLFPGGHFYYRDRQAEFGRVVRAALPAAVAAEGRES